MATLTSSLNTEFTPAAGDFLVQCSSGVVELQRSGASGAPWVAAGILSGNSAPIVSNPVAGARYRFIAVAGTPVVQADQ